jgi:hypothetical protein
MVLLVLIAAAAALTAIFAWPGVASEVLADLHTWFGYVSGPMRRQ